MTSLIVLISLAIAALLLYHILGPREVWDFDRSEGALAALRRRRERALRALKDVELEREMGALSDEEFFRLRNDLKRRAIDAMRALDRAREMRLRTLGRPRSGVPPSVRRRIEALVAKRKEAR